MVCYFVSANTLQVNIALPILYITPGLGLINNIEMTLG